MMRRVRPGIFVIHMIRKGGTEKRAGRQIVQSREDGGGEGRQLPSTMNINVLMVIKETSGCRLLKERSQF